MSVGTADVAKALNTAWDASTLNETFQALWTDPTETEFPVLHEQEAGGEQPWPYCVFEMPTPTTNVRMSGGDTTLREIRDYPIRFHIHTTNVDGDSRSAKEIAAYLAEEVMKVFGGHPSVTPTGNLSLDNGNFLISTYQNDYAVRESDDHYVWIVYYIFRIDVPVAA